MAALVAGSAPIGFGAGLETGANDVLDPELLEIYLRPELTYAFAATGLTAGLAWVFPVLPEAAPGALEAWQEYEHLFPGVLVEVGNKNTFLLQPFETEGYLYLIAKHGVRDLSLELEMDAAYAPSFLLITTPGLAYEKNLGLGTLGAGIDQNLVLAPRPELGDMEFYVSYEIVVRGFRIIFEIDPTIISGGSFTLSAFLRLERFF